MFHPISQKSVASHKFAFTVIKHIYFDSQWCILPLLFSCFQKRISLAHSHIDKEWVSTPNQSSQTRIDLIIGSLSPLCFKYAVETARFRVHTKILYREQNFHITHSKIHININAYINQEFKMHRDEHIWSFIKLM